MHQWTPHLPGHSAWYLRTTYSGLGKQREGGNASQSWGSWGGNGTASLDNIAVGLEQPFCQQERWEGKQSTLLPQLCCRRPAPSGLLSHKCHLWAALPPDCLSGRARKQGRKPSSFDQAPSILELCQLAIRRTIVWELVPEFDFSPSLMGCVFLNGKPRAGRACLVLINCT